MITLLRKNKVSQHFSQFPRPFWFLTIGSFLNRIGGFVMPFFTLYLTHQRGLSISQATTIISFMGFGSLGGSLLGGILADKLGRRKTILAELMLSGSLMFIMGCVQSVALLIACAICLQFLYQLARPVFAATIADMIPQEMRIHAYSIRYWFNNIGSAVGPMLAGLVAPLSYFLLFVGDSLTTLIFFFIVWFGVPETLPTRIKIQSKPPTKEYLRTAFSDPLLWSYSLLAFVFNCIYIQWSVTLPLDMYTHGLHEVSYGAVAAVNALLVVAIGLPLTAFFAHVSHNTAMIIAVLSLGLGLGIYSFTHSLYGYMFGVLIWTCGEIIYFPLSNALIAAISPTHLRGAYQGVFSTMNSLSSLIGPLVGGLILQYLGANFLWRSCLTVGILLALVYFMLGKIQQTVEKKQG